MKVVTAQLGRRMHYAVPRLLCRRDVLTAFHTDLYFSAGELKYIELLKYIPGVRKSLIERAQARSSSEIDDEFVQVHPALGLFYLALKKLSVNANQRLKMDLLVNQLFGRLVGSAIGQSDGSIVYGFNGAAKELFYRARRSRPNIKCVLEQTILPAVLRKSLLEGQLGRHRGWEGNPVPPAISQLAARERSEWERSDMILCGSDYVRDGLVSVGVSSNKIRTVPYGVEPRSCDEGDRRSNQNDEELRILTVGQVGIRKGTPYLVAAAEELGREFQFRLAGAIEPGVSLNRGLPENVETLGSLPYKRVVEEYKEADVYLLPSLCEGSATSTYEALSFGLPVVCTRNAGSIVRDGQEGVIIEEASTEAIVNVLRRVREQPQLLDRYSEAALSRSRQYGSLDAYGARLEGALSDLSIEDQ